MKLLFDQNLSPRLVVALAGAYPESVHVQSIGLDRGSDDAIWEFARDHDFVIVTKDSDFHEMSLLRGFPPKVIWLRRPNCSTDNIRGILLDHVQQIQTLTENDVIAFLILL